MVTTKPKVSTTIETITPKKAETLLGQSANANMRGLRTGWVKQIARAILEGRWEFNGESIKIDSEGSVVDGQHRLAACAMAKKPIETVVIRGVESTTYVDIGHSRSPSQLLAAEGYKNPGQLATAARLVYLWRGPGITRLGSPTFQPDRGVVQLVVREHPGLARSVELAKGCSHILPRSILAFVHYEAAQASEDSDMADLFVEAVVEGVGISKGEGPHLLRERMMREKQSRQRQARLDVIALTIRAWNAWAAGRKMQRLLITRRADPGEGAAWAPEAFPQIEPAAS